MKLFAAVIALLTVVECSSESLKKNQEAIIKRIERERRLSERRDVRSSKGQRGGDRWVDPYEPQQARSVPEPRPSRAPRNGPPVRSLQGAQRMVHPNTIQNAISDRRSQAATSDNTPSTTDASRVHTRPRSGRTKLNAVQFTSAETDLTIEPDDSLDVPPQAPSEKIRIPNELINTFALGGRENPAGGLGRVEYLKSGSLEDLSTSEGPTEPSSSTFADTYEESSSVPATQASPSPRRSPPRKYAASTVSTVVESSFISDAPSEDRDASSSLYTASQSEFTTDQYSTSASATQDDSQQTDAQEEEEEYSPGEEEEEGSEEEREEPDEEREEEPNPQ